MGSTFRRWLFAACAWGALGCSTPEAMPDTGALDSTVACTSDSVCSNGLFCDGAEVCHPGASGADARGCMSASAPCTSGQTCNEVTDRCDSSCGVEDADHDGRRSVACGGDDCDDADPNRFPGNTEVCDTASHDEDCDPLTYGATDIDHDGYVSSTCCNMGAGTVAHCGDDCNDMGASAHPTAPEVCNGLDDDCDARIDEGVQTTFYVDADHDTYGIATGSVMACMQGAGYAAVAGDCDDTMPAVHPGAMEVCNGGIDDDCNSLADGLDGLTCSCSGMTTRACPSPGVCSGGMQTCAGGTWGPCTVMATSEVCNGLDDDCNGMVDDGSASASCTAMPFSIATCTASTCHYACMAPYADCTAAPGCETNTATSTSSCLGCGMACTPGANVTGVACLVPTGCAVTACNAASGTADCDGTMPGGFANGCETSLRTATNCGACGNPCPVLAHATASCPSMTCQYACVAGFANCTTVGGADCETPTTSDPLHCGGCSPCTAPANATATCAASTCGFTCNAGYALTAPTTCTLIGTPRVIGPLADQVVTSRHPQFRVALGASSDGFHVDVCRDAACSMVVASQDATGTSLSLTTALAPATYYWRATGRNLGTMGTSSTAARRFVTYATADTAHATVAQTFLDLDGNGTDLVLATGANLFAFLYRSNGASGIDTTADQPMIDGRPATQFGFALSPAGDVNGDGRGDLLVGACGPAPTSCSGGPPCAPTPSTCANQAFVYYASASSPGTFDLGTRSTITAPAGANGFGYSVGAAGDFNADGYADVIVGAYWTEAAYVYLGSATGIVGATPIVLSVTPTTPPNFFGVSVNGAGDFNGDGYGDVVVGDPLVVSKTFVFLGPTGAMHYTLDDEWGGGAHDGLSVSCAGDFDGDGLPDVVTGGNGTPSSPGVSGGGLAVIFRGTTVAPGTINRYAFALGTVVNGTFGTSVSGLGDVDGDGRSDVVVGAPGEMRAYVLRGAATASSSVALVPAWSVTGGATFGRWVGGVGDVNLDGHADFVVAQPPGASVYLGGSTAPTSAHAVFAANCNAGLPR